MNTTQITILADLGLAAPMHFEPKLVCAQIVNASADVALLRVRGPEPYDAIMTANEYYEGRPFTVGAVLVLEQLSAPPRPTLSAVRPELVAMLLDGPVPEVRSGTVQVMDVARQPGERAKVAVASTEEGVDPVASCVGRGANRVKSVIELLGGERVDVVSWHPDAATYLRNALAPAAVRAVHIDLDRRRAVVVAPAHTMPAAVGNHGLNASLAGRLVGLRVQVVPEGADPEAVLASNEW